MPLRRSLRLLQAPEHSHVPAGPLGLVPAQRGKDLIGLDISVDQEHVAVLNALAARTAAAGEQR
ncbi:hypothetical protein ACFWMU_31495 [Streptomyces sp. NPDC058357]|uniref:hypothetical protein n=1 Tax=unclassified Streptomyces TaxID=2593676 RepID=UPI003653A1DD